jgi:pyruvate formate lyase activating enzyme
MHEIKEFFEKIGKKDAVKCVLCPHNCTIIPGKKGLCGTRANENGRFYSLVYGRPSAMHIDPIEKKPLYHFYPGSEILSVGTLGCNLFCRGCQNYDISKGPIIKLPEVTPEEVVLKAKNSGVKMIAYTYNEPTIFYEYMMDIAKLAKREKIKNVIVSNGFINHAPLKKLIRYIDAANIDLKGFDEKFYKEYANAELAPILKTLKTIKHSDTWLEITNLLIPELNDDEFEIKKMCEWINKNVKDTPLHFSRFFPYYKVQDKEMTPEQTLLNAKQSANDAGIKYVYIGNIGLLENTYCPDCNNLLIERHPHVKILGITDGKCSNCRKKIPGVFN